MADCERYSVAGSSFRTTVGLRGRVTVPVAVQEKAGLAVGDPVVVRAVGPGVVVIETPQAITDRIRSGVPNGWSEEESHEDSARQ